MRPQSEAQPQRPHRDEDLQEGALEGDRPEDPQHSNPHGDALDEEGLPQGSQAIAEDVLGAQEDKTQG